jgi:hypothetical protein
MCRSRSCSVQGVTEFVIPGFVRNVTVALDDDIARWARVEAARRDVSVSRFIRDLLEEQRHRQREYETAMRGYFSRPARPLSGGDRYPSREEIYERRSLR